MNINLRKAALFFGFALSFPMAYAQTDSTDAKMLEELSNIQDKKEKKKSEPITATFKGTYIQNFQSVEQPGKGVLQVMIMHRFGKINEGFYELFGLDNANIRLGLDYGITDKLMVSAGRSSYGKAYDVAAKYKILSQTTDNKMPITLSLYPGLTYTTLKQTANPWYQNKHRLAYFAQILVARKFNDKFSAEIIPTFVHYNLVALPSDKNNILAVGIGGRYKLGRRMSINAEYSFFPEGHEQGTKVYNGLSFGLDIETGGHVFQFVFSNSRSMTVPGYVAQNGDSWRDGGIFFGFNMSRVFQVVR